MADMPFTAVIGAPTSMGAHAPGQEQAPAALRAAGVADGLVDLGDTTLRRWAPDREHRRAQNAAAVADAAGELAALVETALRDSHRALVLGGDCTVELGVVAGARRAGRERVGLVYFDMHPDLNTPETVTTGTLDWMGTAHLLGLPGTIPEVANLARLAPEDLLLFARDPGETKPGEQAAIEAHDIATSDIDQVAADPRTTAARAAARFNRYLVHFDVDVVDFTDTPLSENPGRNEGIAYEQAAAVLAVLLASGALAGVTVTELNPNHVEEGAGSIERLARDLAGGLTRSLSIN
jgi:arginase